MYYDWRGTMTRGRAPRYQRRHYLDTHRLMREAYNQCGGTYAQAGVALVMALFEEMYFEDNENFLPRLFVYHCTRQPGERARWIA